MAVVALATVAALPVACAGSAGRVGRSVVLGGERVPVARLVDAHGALCDGAAHPDASRALFFDRAHEALHTVARAVEDVDRAEAAELLEAKEKVESELDARPANLPDDLRRLAGAYQAALRRLAIAAPPCEK